MITQEFFDSIAGQKLKYKRVNDSPLRYAGGKSLAVGFIAEQLPSNLERLVSPFFGGGSFEVALAKRTGVEVLGYDIFEMLTNYWHYQAEQPEALQGVHSENVMLIGDEASGIPEQVFEAAAGSMSGHNAVTLLLGNPVRSSGFFYDTHNRLSGDWITM